MPVVGRRCFQVFNPRGTAGVSAVHRGGEQEQVKDERKGREEQTVGHPRQQRRCRGSFLNSPFLQGGDWPLETLV